MRSVKFSLLVLIFFGISATLLGQRYMEDIDRGVVAVREGGKKVFISWRMLGTEPDHVAYNIYRSTNNEKFVKLNKKPLNTVTFFIDSLADLTKSNAWSVKAIISKKE